MFTDHSIYGIFYARTLMEHQKYHAVCPSGVFKLCRRFAITYLSVIIVF